MSHGVRILVSCPDCSQVRVCPGDVTLRNCVDDDSWTYRFRCPSCKRLAVGPASRSACFEAVAAGAAVESWHLPAELSEHRDNGPALTQLDALALRATLGEPDWFETLQALTDDQT